MSVQATAARSGNSSPRPQEHTAPNMLGGVLSDATNTKHTAPAVTPEKKALSACAPESASKLLGSVKKRLRNWDDQMVDTVHSALGNAERAQKSGRL